MDLFELPLIETNEAVTPRKLVSLSAFRKIVSEGYHIEHISEEVVHKLSHQTIRARFYRLKLKPKAEKSKEFLHIPFQKIHDYPVPRLIERYFEELLQS